MINDLRSFLSTRIKSARQQRDKLLETTSISLLKGVSVNGAAPPPTYGEQLAVSIAVVDELTKVANFLDFTSTNIPEGMDGRAKWRVIINQFFSAFDKWFEGTDIDWAQVDEAWLTSITAMLDKHKEGDYTPIESPEHVTFLGLAMMIKNWHGSDK